MDVWLYYNSLYPIKINMQNKIQEFLHSKVFYWIARIFLLTILYVPLLFGILRCANWLLEMCASAEWAFYKTVMHIWAIIVIATIGIFARGIVYTWWASVDYLLRKMIKIEGNMLYLPKKTAIQFSAPRWISPSEMWFLLYQDADVSNFLVLFYLWESDGVIEIIEKENVKYLKKKSDLNVDAVKYELDAFKMIFEKNDKIPLIDAKNILEKNKIDLNRQLLDFCVKKKRLVLRKSKKRKVFLQVAMFTIWFPFVFFIAMLSDLEDEPIKSVFDVLLIALILGVVAYYLTKFFIAWYRNWVWKFGVQDIKFTKKGEDLFKEVLWYKYYLEKCEEKEIARNISDKKLLRKVIPYAIVFKLNRKILDNLF